MGVVTRIEPGKRNRGRYKVYIDDEIISLDQELVVKYRLKVGTEVDTMQLRQWVEEDNLKKSFDMALRYLGFRPRSRKEIEEYLAGKGFEDRTIECTVNKLQGYGYIDDLNFAQMWAKNRMSGNPMGKRMIKYELYYKGIEEDTIEQALENISNDEEEEAAIKLAQKYCKRYKNLEGKELMYKVGQAMARRGFDWEVIQRVCRKIGIED